MPVKVKLSNGLFALVDRKDAKKVSLYKWHCRRGPKTFYAIASIYKKSTTLFMHRLILDLEDPKVLVDNKDCNGLNNTRSNLRTCTPKQNTRNKKTPVNNTSGYKGVVAEGKKWVARHGFTELAMLSDRHFSPQAWVNLKNIHLNAIKNIDWIKEVQAKVLEIFK